jgi:chaperonin GroEL (HSP60 family)
MHDALMVAKDVIERPVIVAGGGAPEAYTAWKLREWANTLSGREQLAVFAFADALETIPITLATNAGMDPIDTLIEIRSKQSQGNKWAGVDVFGTKIADIYRKGILEPLVVKELIIKSATEVAIMILRIDDVIAASRPKEGPKAPEPMME